MRKELRAVLAFISIFISFGSGALGIVNATSLLCMEEANMFLDSPSASTMDLLADHDSPDCWNTISTNANLNRMIRSVQIGNRWATRYLVEHIDRLDGGNLEDSLIALGEFSEKNPERFFMFANDGLLSERNVKDAVTMLPLLLSDDSRAQLTVLKMRRIKVAGVRSPDFRKQRAIALKAIDDFMIEIQSHEKVETGL